MELPGRTLLLPITAPKICTARGDANSSAYRVNARFGGSNSAHEAREVTIVHSCPGSRDIGGAGFGRNVVPPVPAQHMVVDRKLSRGSFDRRAGRQKTLDPHTFGMITTPAPASREPPWSRYLFPHHYISKNSMQQSSQEYRSKTESI